MSMSRPWLDFLGALYWTLVIAGGIWLLFPWRKLLHKFGKRNGDDSADLVAPTQSSGPPHFVVKVLWELVTALKWIGGAVLIWAVLLSWPVRFATWVAGEWYGGLLSNRTDATVQGYMLTENQTCSRSCWEALMAEEDPLYRYKERPLEFVEFTIPSRIRDNFARDRFAYKKSDGEVIPPKDLDTLVLDAYHERVYPEQAKSNGFTFQGPGIYRVQLESIPYSQCVKFQAERRSLDQRDRERTIAGVSSAMEQLPAEEDMASLLVSTNENYKPIIRFAKNGQCPVIRKVDAPGAATSRAAGAAASCIRTGFTRFIELNIQGEST